MKNNISYVLFFLFITFPLQVMASCLEHPILLHFEKESPDFLAASFSSCVYANQCTTAIRQLEKLKNVDPVRYAFIKGCALANGDCYKQNLKEAENNLSFCSKYTATCKNNLLDFYYLFAKNKSKFKNLALSVADEGYHGAYGYLAEVAKEEGDSGLGRRYLWLTIYKLWSENKLRIYISKFEEIPHNEEKKEIRYFVENEISNLKVFIKEINDELVIPKQKLAKRDLGILDHEAIKFISSLKNKQTPKDELSQISMLYQVDGKAKAKLKKRKYNSPQANSPNFGLDERIILYRRMLEEIIM